MAIGMWIDTHCHLDAAEFGGDTASVRRRAAQAGVVHCVLPAVAVSNFDTVRELAHRHGDSYALGIHPLCTPDALDEDLEKLDQALAAHRDDPRLVAVGEIGLDHFVPGLDPLRQDDLWLYLPSLRRVRRLSSAQRSEALFGQDIDVDSYGGYAGQIPWFTWKFVGEKPMLASLHGENLPPVPCKAM